MKENYAVENALGTIGAVLWMIQNIPQVIKSYREKSTKGLSASLMLWVKHVFPFFFLANWTDQEKKSIWALGTVIHGAYIIAQNFSIPLQVQPQVFAALATVSWCQCLHYGKGYSVKSVWAIFIVLCGIFAGFEVGSVYALWVRFTDQSARLIELLTFWVGILGRAPKRSGVANLDVWISLCCPFGPWAVVSSVKICCPSGSCWRLVIRPQYWEIYKYREVIGISILFMAIDILGGVFSFLSLLFRKDLDIAGFVSPPPSASSSSCHRFTNMFYIGVLCSCCRARWHHSRPLLHSQPYCQTTSCQGSREAAARRRGGDWGWVEHSGVKISYVDRPWFYGRKAEYKMIEIRRNIERWNGGGGGTRTERAGWLGEPGWRSKA